MYYYYLTVHIISRSLVPFGICYVICWGWNVQMEHSVHPLISARCFSVQTWAGVKTSRESQYPLLCISLSHTHRSARLLLTLCIVILNFMLSSLGLYSLTHGFDYHTHHLSLFVSLTVFLSVCLSLSQWVTLALLCTKLSCDQITIYQQ